jgi:hypothetical protein
VPDEGSPSRKIITFMAFTVVFSLVGHTVKVKKGTAKSGSDVTILLGGVFAATLLTLLADLGSEGAAWAVGLSEVSLLSSVLINGAPVFTQISNTSKGL